MAALTTDTTLFGAVGASNPERYVPGLTAVRRTINFNEVDTVTASTNYEFLPLPAMFVVTGVLVRETEACTTGTIDVALKSDSTKLASAVSVGGSTLATDYKTVSNLIRTDGDMVCLTPSAAMKTGTFEVTVLGFLPNVDSKDNYVLDVPYKTSLQTKDNVSGGDTYLKKLNYKKL